MIKKAADKLLAKNEITKDEHESFCKIALKFPGVGMFTRKAQGKGLTDKLSKSNTLDILQGLALGALGVKLTTELGGAAISKVKSFNDYDDMMKKNPMLSEYDKKDTKDYFGVVKTFSPKSASSPLVAGALVNKMIQFGGVDHKIVQDLVSIESNINKPGVLSDLAGGVSKAITGVV